MAYFPRIHTCGCVPFLGWPRETLKSASSHCKHIKFRSISHILSLSCTFSDSQPRTAFEQSIFWYILCRQQCTLRQLAIYIKPLCLLDDVGWYLNKGSMCPLCSTYFIIWHSEIFWTTLESYRIRRIRFQGSRVSCATQWNHLQGPQGAHNKGRRSCMVTWRDVTWRNMTWLDMANRAINTVSRCFRRTLCKSCCHAKNLVALCCYIASSTFWLWFCCWVFLMDSDGGYRVIGLSRWNLWGWHTFDELLAFPRNACWSD